MNGAPEPLSRPIDVQISDLVFLVDKVNATNQKNKNLVMRTVHSTISSSQVDVVGEVNERATFVIGDVSHYQNVFVPVNAVKSAESNLPRVEGPDKAYAMGAQSVTPSFITQANESDEN